MKIVNKSIIDYWRKDVNMRLLIEKSCKNVDNALIVKRLEALKAIIAFYNTTHTDLIAKATKHTQHLSLIHISEPTRPY